MDRRSLIRRTGIAGVLAAGVAPAVHAQATVRWRLASSFPKSLDTLWGFSETLSRKVSEMSSGKFQISIHPAGELVPAFGVVDVVQNGSIDLAHTAPYYFTGKDTVFALASGIPFGFNARQIAAWMIQGNGRKLMNEFFANYNMISFDGGHTGTQMGGWYRKPIKEVADLKGLKIRLGGGLVGEVMGKLGAVPQSIPGGEVYVALEKGSLDAVEWIGPYDDFKLGFYKVAPYYYYPGWWEGDAHGAMLVNTKAWSGLPAEYKAMFETACGYASRESLARYDGLNPPALKQLAAAKTQILPFPQPVLEAAYKATQEVYAELDAKNPAWRKIYADMLAFQRDQVLWFRFAESRYDQFMATRKL